MPFIPATAVVMSHPTPSATSIIKIIHFMNILSQDDEKCQNILVNIGKMTGNCGICRSS
jgi:hypothetical protein